MAGTPIGIQRMTDEVLAREIYFAKVAHAQNDQATTHWLDTLLREQAARREVPAHA